MSKKFNLFSISLLTIYFLIGIFLSLNTGISHDEHHEQLNWEVNFNSAKDFFLLGGYEDLLNYKDKYHGIGFNILSQPFQSLIKDLIRIYLDINEYGSILISKHIIVFILFFISGLFFYSICKIFFNDKKFALISLFIFYLYPYLFGHSHFNPKDIPFLSFWIICTYFICRIIQKIIYEKKIPLKMVFFISLSTSILISIRIVGLLILLQYLIFIIVYLENKNKNFLEFINSNKKNFFLFFILIIFFVFLMNPIFWHNPQEILNSVKWMSKYQQDICTVTLGDCMKSLNLPSSYYFIWLFFKLPIFIILGFLAFPFIEKKLSNNFLNKIFVYSFSISLFSILILFIIFNVSIYDEIRHVMFLIPLIFLISLNNLYLLNKKISSYFGMFVIIFFIFENFSINPYQYTWMNSFSKFYNINKNFEVDYWGLSNKNLYNSINLHSIKFKSNKQNCVYGDLYSKVFLENKNFTCFKQYSQLDSAKDRPFYVVKNLRNFKRSDPKNCSLIKMETYKYSFSNQIINVGSAWYCD